MDGWVSQTYSRIEKPYKVVFLASVVVSVTGGALKFFFGVDASQIYAGIAVSVFIAVTYLLMESGIRYARNRKARKGSESPEIKLLTEETILNFSNPQYVTYERRMTVRSVDGVHDGMSLYINWQGRAEDVCVEDQIGCTVSLRKAKDLTGYYITVKFTRPVSSKYVYSFGFKFGFDNSNGMVGPFIHKIYSYCAEKSMTQTVAMRSNSKNRFVHSILRSPHSHQVLKEFYEDNVDYSTFHIKKPHQGRGYRISTSS